jgi:hypothetical protein
LPLSTKSPGIVQCSEPDVADENTSTSSTNPHPEEYLNERLARILGEPDDDGTQPSDSIFHFKEEVCLENVLVDDLDPNTRVVVAPTMEETLDFSTSYGTVPLRFPRAEADVLMVTQSSRNADFVLSFGQHAFNFVYDSTSDGLFIRNRNARGYVLERLTTYDGNHQESCQSLLKLDAYSTMLLGPGVWRIGQVPELFCKLLLVPRRYIVRRGRTSPSRLGSKRVAAPLVATYSKRAHSGCVSSNGQLSVVDTGNALASLELGEFVTVQTERQPSSELDIDSDAYPSNILEHPHIHPNATENYTISHIRDIAVNKANAAVYHASHSTYGEVAVKVIRRKHASRPASMAKIAQEWRHEELVLRKISHVRTCSCRGPLSDDQTVADIIFIIGFNHQTLRL